MCVNRRTNLSRCPMKSTSNMPVTSRLIVLRASNGDVASRAAHLSSGGREARTVAISISPRGLARLLQPTKDCNTSRKPTSQLDRFAGVVHLFVWPNARCVA